MSEYRLDIPYSRRAHVIRDGCCPEHITRQVLRKLTKEFREIRRARREVDAR